MCQLMVLRWMRPELERRNRNALKIAKRSLGYCEACPREADVIRQFHLEGKSYREISASLGIPENSIGPTLSRALDRMRQRT